MLFVLLSCLTLFPRKGKGELLNVRYLSVVLCPRILLDTAGGITGKGFCTAELKNKLFSS